MYLSEFCSISKSNCKSFLGDQLPGSSSLFVAATVEAETFGLKKGKKNYWGETGGKAV